MMVHVCYCIIDIPAQEDGHEEQVTTVIISESVEAIKLDSQ